MTTLDLSQQRCRNHAEREAAARCPSCGHFYCRECVTEHEDQVRCAACLRKEARVSLLRRPVFSWVIQTAECLLGLLIAWFFFSLIGELLLALPSSFHEGTFWQIQQ